MDWETAFAASPEIPESTSSNIRTGVESALARIVLIASMILAASPPDAVFESGLRSSPLFAENKNSTSS